MSTPIELSVLSGDRLYPPARKVPLCPVQAIPNPAVMLMISTIYISFTCFKLISREWQVCTISYLASLTPHNVSETHPRCCVPQELIPLYHWIIFHCTMRLEFAYPFTCGRTYGLFPVSSYWEPKLLLTCMRRSIFGHLFLFLGLTLRIGIAGYMFN